jgi:hypothetical protein
MTTLIVVRAADKSVTYHAVVEGELTWCQRRALADIGDALRSKGHSLYTSTDTVTVPSARDIIDSVRAHYNIRTPRPMEAWDVDMDMLVSCEVPCVETLTSCLRGEVLDLLIRGKPETGPEWTVLRVRMLIGEPPAIWGQKRWTSMKCGHLYAMKEVRVPDTYSMGEFENGYKPA